MRLSLVVVALAALCVGADEDLAARLKSKDPAERLAAVRELAAGTHEKKEKLLASALKDDDWQVIEEAAAELGRMGARGSSKLLADLAIAAPVRRLRARAAEAAARLALIDGEAVWDELAKEVAGKDAEAACDAMAFLAPALDGKVSLGPIEKALKSKEPTARMAAARALVRLGGERKEELLGRLLRDDSLAVRAAALEGAALAGDPPLMRGALAVLVDPEADDVLVRRAVEVFRASLLAHPDTVQGFEVEMRSELRGRPESPAGARLARLMGELAELRGEKRALESAVALDMLEPLLASEDPRIRSAAAGALGKIGGDEALRAALKLMQGDSDGHVRLIALEASLVLWETSAAHGVGVLEALLKLVEQDSDARVRERAAVALGRKNVTGAVDALAAATRDADANVAVCAAVSLGKTRSAAAVPTLAALCLSPDWKLRGAAVVGLSHVQHPDAVPLVMERLADPEPCVRRSAHESLCSLARERREPSLEGWRTWWAENQKFVSFVDRKELEKRRERLGETTRSAEIYQDVDVVVLQSRGDHIESVFDFEKVTYRVTGQGGLDEAELHPRAALIVNCSGEINASDVERIAWFVRVGGALFGSCWALHETLVRACPGFVQRLETKGEVLDDVSASPCAGESPYLAGVFPRDVHPIYALEGAFLIDVVDPERVEVLLDSPACAERWGGGNLAAWFRSGHGLVLDSANHFDVQGLARATHLKKPQERMAYAVDHIGLSLENLRELRGEAFWAKSQDAAERVKDLSVFRLVTNFVRLRLLEEE